jgi:hypothetical protein
MSLYYGSAVFLKYITDSGLDEANIFANRARIYKRLRSPGIDSEESIQSANEAWRAGTTNRVVVPVRQAENRFLGFLKGLQIRALKMAVNLAVCPTEKTMFIILLFCTTHVLWYLCAVSGNKISIFFALFRFLNFSFCFILTPFASMRNKIHVFSFFLHQNFHFN